MSKNLEYFNAIRTKVSRLYLSRYWPKDLSIKLPLKEGTIPCLVLEYIKEILENEEELTQYRKKIRYHDIPENPQSSSECRIKISNFIELLWMVAYYKYHFEIPIYPSTISKAGNLEKPKNITEKMKLSEIWRNLHKILANSHSKIDKGETNFPRNFFMEFNDQVDTNKRCKRYDAFAELDSQGFNKNEPDAMFHILVHLKVMEQNKGRKLATFVEERCENFFKFREDVLTKGVFSEEDTLENLDPIQVRLTKGRDKTREILVLWKIKLIARQDDKKKNSIIPFKDQDGKYYAGANNNTSIDIYEDGADNNTSSDIYGIKDSQIDSFLVDYVENFNRVVKNQICSLEDEQICSLEDEKWLRFEDCIEKMNAAFDLNNVSLQPYEQQQIALQIIFDAIPKLMQSIGKAWGIKWQV